MKKYTRKLLNKTINKNTKYVSPWVNAKKAERRLKMPAALYVEVTNAAYGSHIISSLAVKATSQHSACWHGFMVGMFIGWAEARRGVK